MALHTDIPTRTQIAQLLAARGDWLLSIYLPTTPVTPQAGADRIAFKNLARQALGELEGRGVAKAEVREVEEALDDLHEDDSFWDNQANSLAIFASSAGVKTFRLPNRLSEAVLVADRYYVKPLLRTVTFPQTAFVLALAEGSVRLLEVTPDLPVFEVKVPDLPADAASAAGKASITDRSAARRLQGSEGQKVLVRQYARRVDDALRPVLAGSDVPLILAAAQPIESIFRSVNHYPHLAEQVIEGSPEGKSDADLAAASRAVLDAIYADQLADLGRLFVTRGDAGRAAAEMTDIARAATFGAVDTLFVDIDAGVSGTIDPETGVLELGDADEPGDYGVLDELARRVVAADGRVLAVRAEDIPGGGAAAAILRYPV